MKTMTYVLLEMFLAYFENITIYIYIYIYVYIYIFIYILYIYTLQNCNELSVCILNLPERILFQLCVIVLEIYIYIFILYNI